ncbi:MAG: NusG domain II-containing protein [Spirochaetales bacterium]|nr:NusG domain II-containing protein [Spirochaetales bacterium]
MDKAGKRPPKLLLDIALILAVLAVGATILLVTRNNREQGAYVVVMVQNKEIARYSMTNNGVYDIYDNNGNTNKIEIRDGRVRMLEASCPNHLCIRQGWIRFEGQSIVCLPNKVTVTVRGTGDGFDFVQ